ncbi:MAG: serine/threonine-protein kinase, partial [Myxococcota bacterium]
MSMAPEDAFGSSSYVRLFEIARGGIGRIDVSVKRGRGFERVYAVKRLHSHLRDDPKFLEMFLDESRIAGLIRHANVVSVLDVGQDREGPFLVMDFVEGVSLRDLMRSLQPGELLPLDVCVPIATQIAAGLAAAHDTASHTGERLNVIHRDLSPHNVLVGADGTVRVLDFGIAKALGGGSETTQGILKGKMGYFSPEQIRFEPIDQRSDLFALGVVLFELLAGRRLYSGTPEKVFPRVLHDSPPDITEFRRGVPPELDDLVLALLAKDREHRPQDAREVAATLQRVLTQIDSEPQTLSDFVHERFAVRLEDTRRRVRNAIVDLDSSAIEDVSEASSAEGPFPFRKGIGLSLVAVLFVALG